MNEPYTFGKWGESQYEVRGPKGLVSLHQTFQSAGAVCFELNAAYAAGRADADKGLREALVKVDALLQEQRYSAKGEIRGIVSAALAATEPAFAKQLRDSVAQLENKP